MELIDFIGPVHRATARDYVARVTEFDKAKCAEVAKKFAEDYWDGERQYGYGGYSYDGRWRPVAERMAAHYGLKAGDKVLDVGCGKAYLLYELTQAVPGLEVTGIDISEYGLAHAKEEVRDNLKLANATDLPFDDNSFDMAFSLATYHNLYVFDAIQALKEIQRVCPGPKKYVMVESYRNESEKANLLYWQLTCESFFTPDEWQWCFAQAGYDGDYGFIYFE
jgi:ubiquinone/menaquinone biosynthesis C-methylase UbiE